jgi:hypothetical protein
MIRTESFSGAGIPQTYEEKTGLGSRIAESVRSEWDKCQGVEVSHTKLSYGDNSTGDLLKMGKKNRMVLTDAGKQVAADNLACWKQELLDAGQETNAANLRQKYLEASVGNEWRDNLSGLIKSSILTRIRNMEKNERVKQKIKNPLGKEIMELRNSWDIPEEPVVLTKDPEREAFNSQDKYKKLGFLFGAIAVGIFAACATVAAHGEAAITAAHNH